MNYRFMPISTIKMNITVEYNYEYLVELIFKYKWNTKL